MCENMYVRSEDGLWAISSGGKGRGGSEEEKGESQHHQQPTLAQLKQTAEGKGGGVGGAPVCVWVPS